MSTVADRVKSMSASELYDASQGKGGATGHDDGLAPPAVWAEAATEELKRRGFAKGIDPTTPTPPNPISADAKYIAWAVDENSDRIIKHMWIIFVLLPVVLGILYVILSAIVK
jgi:hypothetical protein